MTDPQTIGCYDRLAARFAKEWEDDQPVPVDLQTIIRRYFRPGLTVDVGCGSGRDAAWLSANGFDVVGVDPSEGLLAEARARHGGVRFEVGALPDLGKLMGGAFANVLCETVIMHLNPTLIPESVRRLIGLLEPQGTLCLTWRVTDGVDKRDEHGRLYSAFAPGLVKEGLSQARIELDEEEVSVSSGKTVHRIVARRT